MIVHSTANTSGDTCLVRVEGIEAGVPDTIVKLFAQGAAGKHNAGYDITASAIEWCDEFGRPLPEGSDTTGATVARVLCRVVEPAEEKPVRLYECDRCDWENPAWRYGFAEAGGAWSFHVIEKHGGAS